VGRSLRAGNLWSASKEVNDRAPACALQRKGKGRGGGKFSGGNLSAQLGLGWLGGEFFRNGGANREKRPMI